MKTSSLEASKIKDIYDRKLARHYDLPISHFFSRYKQVAIKKSKLNLGDSVLVFCCGTGLDFQPILEKIGKDGTIVGIDFSAAMLNRAIKRIEKNKWNNIELIQADVTQFRDTRNRKFNAGICTLGISIIPEYLKAYENLVTHIRAEGEIIIGDMQLATGRYARLNPLTIGMAKRFGGSKTGHGNSLDICSKMEQELKNYEKKEYFMKSYFIARGTV